MVGDGTGVAAGFSFSTTCLLRSSLFSAPSSDVVEHKSVLDSREGDLLGGGGGGDLDLEGDCE